MIRRSFARLARRISDVSQTEYNTSRIALTPLLQLSSPSISDGRTLTLGAVESHILETAIEFQPTRVSIAFYALWEVFLSVAFGGEEKTANAEHTPSRGWDPAAHNWRRPLRRTSHGLRRPQRRPTHCGSADKALHSDPPRLVGRGGRRSRLPAE